MAPRGAGSIINMASIMGLSGGGLYPNISYQATKGAVVNMTRALAVEFGPSKVRVNAIAPTWVRTGFIAPLLQDAALVGRMEAMMPLGRLAETADLVGAALFLAGRASAMVTGHVLAVDGGFLAQ
jgi:NAD(P)-dependent dehydrogenase (short-subunit alcohol dehydrogenase family)